MITLHEITPARIQNGGYSIKYTGQVPPNANLWLGIPDMNHKIDVTGRSANDLLGWDNLAKFLACLGGSRLWGQKTTCRLFVEIGGKVVKESNPQTFACPTRPYVGKLSPADLGRGDAGPPLKYTGNGTGRMLYMPAIDGCYYFAYGGKFETADQMRGFDCTTYAGAVFGVDSKSGAMSGYGTQLANHLMALPCNLENKTGDQIRAYFEKQATGTYLMWSDSHVVIVVNGVVHEFSQSKGGYAATPIKNWNFHGKRYWMRKPGKQF